MQITSVRLSFYFIMSCQFQNVISQNNSWSFREGRWKNQMDTGRFADIVYLFWFGFYFTQNLLEYVSMYFWYLWPF